MRLLIAAIVWLLPLSVIAESLPVDSTPPGSDLVGTWTLDADRSDSIKPMMELMGAPWAVRQMVASLTPTMTVRLTATGLHVVNKTRVRETAREIVTDGQGRDSKDALDRTVTERARWQEDGTLKVWRTVPREDEAPLEVEAVWRRNGEWMELDSTVRADGEEPVRTLRVFTRVAS